MFHLAVTVVNNTRLEQVYLVVFNLKTLHLMIETTTVYFISQKRQMVTYSNRFYLLIFTLFF